MKKFSFTRALLGMGMGIGMNTGAWTQSADAWLFQAGMTRVMPVVASGTLTAPAPSNTQIDASSDSRATAQVAYMLTHAWSIAVPLGTGFKHKLYGAGAIAGVGQIATVSVMPVTALLQYRWGGAQEPVRPYTMLGLSYVRFYDAQGSATLNGINPLNPAGGRTTLYLASQWAPSVGLGLYAQVNDDWFLDISYSKSYLSTTATLSTGQTISARLDPYTVVLGVGKRF